MMVFNIIDAADQQFGTIINNQRVTIRLRWNLSSERWSFDLAIDDLPVLTGRRIVCGIDLLSPFNFGIGAIFALPAVPGAEPGREELPAGDVRLYHATQAEIDAERATLALPPPVFKPAKMAKAPPGAAVLQYSSMPLTFLNMKLLVGNLNG